MWFQRSVPFLLLALAGLPVAQAQQVPAPTPSNALQLWFLGRYQTGIFGESAAEIVAHDPQTQRLFVVKATAAAVDVLDIRNPRALPLCNTLIAPTDVRCWWWRTK